MSKSSGLGDNLYVSGYDLSGDVGSLSRIAGGPNPSEVTGIDKSAMERIGLLRDGGIEWSGWFNDAALHEHVVLRTLPTADRIVSYHRGTTLGNPAAALIGKQINYDPTRGADGSLSFSVQALPNGYGLEWGRQLTAGQIQHAGETVGDSIDIGAEYTFGLQAYLHVFAFNGTDCTLTIQESSDDGSADAFTDVTGGAFTVVTSAPFSERIATANDQTIEQYLLINSTGTFTTIDFAVIVVVNQAAVVF